VELHERRVQSADDEVGVVARIADDRRTVRPPRQVFEEPTVFQHELDRVGRVVQLRLSDRAAAVDRVEVEARGAVVG